ADREDVNSIDPLPPEEVDTDIDHTNFYAYASVNYPQAFTWVLGASGDFLDGSLEDTDQFNPKFGLIWTPFPATTLRGAIFRTLQRTLIASQTIEPTQVAGFNQFFDDAEGVDAWRYGIAADQKFSSRLNGGVELSMRDLEVPFEDFSPPLFLSEVKEADWEEWLFRAYLYWTPQRWFALSAEYQYEDLERDSEFVGDGLFTDLKTHRVPLGIGFFHPTGIIARLNATYVYQDGNFGDPFSGVESDDDRFWVMDATMSYRLPNRYGLISLEAKNLFDEAFKFQDTDPSNPRIIPERMIFGRITLSF
ncbi:MAG: TonB-dependent receptor, partial [Desulfobacterales bacterium]